MSEKRYMRVCGYACMRKTESLGPLRHRAARLCGSWLPKLLPILIVSALLLPAIASDRNGGHDAFIREFSRTLVMDNGRIKPMETYARYALLGLHGHSSRHGKSAVEFMYGLMFDPGAGNDTAKIVLINDPSIADAIGIVPQKSRRYSLQELQGGYEKLEENAQRIMLTEPNQRSSVDNEMLRLYLNLRNFTMVLKSPGGSSYTMHFSTRCAIFPLDHNGAIEWTDLLSAIDSCRPNGDSLAAAKPGCVDCGMVSVFLHSRDRADTLAAFNALVRQKLASHGISIPVRLEIFYDRLDPFFWARLAYLLALLALCAGVVSGKRLWPVSASIALSGGLLLHSLGLVLRTLIMHRPPLASFYETFVSVAWIGVALGLLVAVFMNSRYGLFIATFMGAAFLSFASRFGADGDTLGMLAPVLNSNFWLTSHIMTISTGYAGCVAAGVLGHIYLVRRLFLGSRPDRLNQLDRTMRALLAIGFTFTTIGTVLGGMWAEQAWGRFWGWDPKENGALLIIIWCAIVFHARAGGLVRETGAAVGTVVGLCLVMLAWVGVNLLGVGMHSYGFTVIGAKALIGIIAVETVFLGVAGVKVIKRS